MDLQTKQCNDQCKKILPIAAFRLTIKKGYRSSCKKCKCAKRRERYALKQSIEKLVNKKLIDEELQKIEIPLKNGKIDRSGDNDGPKKCAGCKLVRLSEHFRKNSQGNWKSHCDVCEREQNRQRAFHKYYEWKQE